MSRLLAALALALSIAAPLHGLLHEHGHEAETAGIEAPGHSHAHGDFEAECPLCTLANSTAITAELEPSLQPIELQSPHAPRAVALASRQGAAAPARGPPAPTC